MATDERTSMVDANGHAWVRLDTARGSFWQILGINSGARVGSTVRQYLASGRFSHIFYVDVGSDFGVFSPAEWRSMLSRCFD